MTVPWQSFLIFWDVLDLYKNIKLECYGGEASTWASRARASTTKYVQQAGLMPEFNLSGSVMAKQIAGRMSADAELDIDRFCLPLAHFALSAPAFMLVLAKMGHCTLQQGCF